LKPLAPCGRGVGERGAGRIVKDVSHGWNLNVGFAANGIAEITILDAKAAGYWPLENAKDLLPLAA